MLGNFDTMHHIRRALGLLLHTHLRSRLNTSSCRGPDALKKIVGLSTKKCTACEGKDAKPLDSEQANKLRNQVPGWQIVEGDKGVLSLRQDWKVCVSLLRLQHSLLACSACRPQMCLSS